MKGKIKKLLIGGMVAVGLMGSVGIAMEPMSMCGISSCVEAASKKPTLNKKKLMMRVGKTFKLKVKKGGKVKKWKTSNKKVVSVSKSGKLKARKVGKAKITAVFKSGRKAVCRVTVKKKVKDNSSRVLPSGKKQSIDSLKFYGSITGGSNLPKNTEKISCIFQIN